MKTFISCDMLTYRVWGELKPLLLKRGIKIVTEEKGNKYVYVEYSVNNDTYELINKLVKKVENMLDI